MSTVIFISYIHKYDKFYLCQHFYPKNEQFKTLTLGFCSHLYSRLIFFQRSLSILNKLVAGLKSRGCTSTQCPGSSPWPTSGSAAPSTLPWPSQWSGTQLSAIRSSRSDSYSKKYIESYLLFLETSAILFIQRPEDIIYRHIKKRVYGLIPDVYLPTHTIVGRLQQ